MITFDDTLRIGHVEIDKQHKKMFEIIDRLMLAISVGKNPNKLAESFSFLKIYTESHFRMEEGFMAHCKYPELEIHKLQHTNLMETLSELEREFLLGVRIPTEYVLEFLKKWLVDHIKDEDIKLVSFIRQGR